jgi:excinuclease ABC subunit C
VETGFGRLPDLILLDGGKGQVNAVLPVVAASGLPIPVFGMVKDDHHRTSTLLFGDPPQEIGLKPTEELFRFLTQIQDEVHRFAIAFHIHKRSKSQTHSELDEIRGIGEKTKSMLLNRFGSVKRIREAKLAELVEIAGNSKGSIVYNHFNSNLSR